MCICCILMQLILDAFQVCDVSVVKIYSGTATVLKVNANTFEPANTPIQPSQAQTLFALRSGVDGGR